MKKICIIGSVAFTMAIMALPASSAQDDPKSDKSTQTEALAKKLVNQCARVKDRDIVQIGGGARDIELLEALTVESAKLGADTLMLLAPSDRTMRRLYTDVPAKFDSRTSPLAMRLAETITVSIGVDSAESDTTFAGIPAERLNARSEASAKIPETHLKRNVRQVWLGNGLYPTEARAQQYGLTKDELSKIFYAGLSVDYDKLQATGEAVRKTLTGGKKVRITTPEGTDVTLEITGRSTFVSDGILTDEKIKRGGAACQMWLPAGEVYLAPVSGGAEGTVVADRQLWEGKEIRGLRMTFKNGKLIEMKARSGLERLQAIYDAAGAGKDELSALDIGINPAVRLPSRTPGGCYMESGTITLNIGNNVWAGGDNKCAFGVPLFLRGGTLRVDAEVLIQDGSLRK